MAGYMDELHSLNEEYDVRVRRGSFLLAWCRRVAIALAVMLPAVMASAVMLWGVPIRQIANRPPLLLFVRYLWAACY